MVIFFFSWQFILSTSSSSMNFLSLLILVFFYCSTFQRLCLSTWAHGKIWGKSPSSHTFLCVLCNCVCVCLFSAVFGRFFGSSRLEQTVCGQIIQSKVCFLCEISFSLVLLNLLVITSLLSTTKLSVSTQHSKIRWKCDFYSKVCVSFVYSWLFFLWQCLVISVCFFQELFCWKIFTSCFKCWIYLHFHLFKFLEHYKLTPTSFHSAWNRSIQRKKALRRAHLTSSSSSSSYFSSSRP